MSDIQKAAHAAYVAFEQADHAFRDAYQDAFGRQGVDRSYEMDRSSHPPACQAAYASRKAAQDRWYATLRAGAEAVA